MPKSARYSTFDSATGDSWTAGKMMRPLASSWLGCCCGSCYKRRRELARVSPGSSSANGTSRTNVLEPIVELNKLKQSIVPPKKLTLEERFFLMRNNYYPKDVSAQNVANSEETLLIRKDNAIDTNFRNKSSSYGSVNEMRRAIGGLPALLKKKNQPLTSEEKKASQSDSKLEYRSSVLAKYSKRHGQQETLKLPLDIPKLMIS